MITPISNQEDKVPLRLSISQQFAVDHRIKHGDLLEIMRRQAARQLAEKIIELEKCFQVKIEGDYGEQRATIIVMTEIEYADLMREQFKKGVNHAHGFMPQMNF